MDWETAGIIAEIVSAIAVFATLLFLAVEVRRNRNATESASIDALATGFNNLNALLISDPEFLESFLATLADPTSQGNTEKARALWLMQSYINHLTSVKKHHDSGALADDDWEAYMGGSLKLVNTPGGQWALSNMGITPAMVEEMNKFSGSLAEDGYMGGSFSDRKRT